MSKGHHSTSGVFIAADFRDDLIIDRYDPVFASMRASKRRRLHSVNSEDAVTWNVFRSLRQIDSTVWLPELFGAAFPNLPAPHASHAVVTLWKAVAPPPSFTGELEEGESEIDVVIETPAWVWFIETMSRGDGGSNAPSKRDRSQVLRDLDVGSYYAGVRPFYFSLLAADRGKSSAGAAAIGEYRDLAKPRELLADHRPDGLANLRGVSLLTWEDLGAVLGDAATDARREDERAFAVRAREWLGGKGLVR